MYRSANAFDAFSDLDSDLSDPPIDLDNVMASSLEVGVKHLDLGGPIDHKRKIISLISDDEDSGTDSSDEKPLAKKQRPTFHRASKFEEMPTEVSYLRSSNNIH